MDILLATSLDDPQPAGWAARWLTERFGASLELLHVTHPDRPLPASGTDTVPATRGIRRQLEEVGEAMGADASLLDTSDDPAKALLETVSAIEPALVVVGSEQRTGLPRVLGPESVAERVALEAERPVLVVPHECDATTLHEGLTVLTAVDLGPQALRVLHTGAAWARLLRGRLVAYHAHGIPPMSVDIAHQAHATAALEKSEAAERWLRDACGDLTFGWFRPEYLHDVATEPARGAIDQAATQGAGLLVVGGRPPGRWSKLWGTTTRHVVRHASIPILVVPLAGD